MSPQLRRLLLALVAACVMAAGLACGDDNKTTSPTPTTPSITSCNTVSYQGTTYSDIGCRVGVASFTTTITQNGKTACFNVTCSNGCAATVRVC